MIQVGQIYQQNIGICTVLVVNPNRCYVRWADMSEGWLDRNQGWFARHKLVQGQMIPEPSVCDIF